MTDHRHLQCELYPIAEIFPLRLVDLDPRSNDHSRPEKRSELPRRRLRALQLGSGFPAVLGKFKITHSIILTISGIPTISRYPEKTERPECGSYAARFEFFEVNRSPSRIVIGGKATKGGHRDYRVHVACPCQGFGPERHLRMTTTCYGKCSPEGTQLAPYVSRSLFPRPGLELGPPHGGLDRVGIGRFPPWNRIHLGRCSIAKAVRAGNCKWNCSSGPHIETGSRSKSNRLEQTLHRNLLVVEGEYLVFGLIGHPPARPKLTIGQSIAKLEPKDLLRYDIRL